MNKFESCRLCETPKRNNKKWILGINPKTFLKHSKEFLKENKGNFVYHYQLCLHILDEHQDVLDKYGLNTCDMCGVIEDSDELIWVTSEDFTPMKGEVLKEHIQNEYDALCVDCYKTKALVTQVIKIRK